ncbi:MAG: hypothetical protein JXB23_06985 [Candidatus Aminicenantes bacterium]|nr:hypothetical protein [Candidatus Aminicenantes bacterium]
MNKAQTEVVTLVLISGIIISLVGFAWTWGVPMIEKRSTVVQFTSAVLFMENLDKKITDMAGTCTTPGSCSETLDLPVPGVIVVDKTGNSIIYTLSIDQPLVTGSEVLFNTADNGTVSRYGETPGVISMEGVNNAGRYTLIFSLRYRELDSDEPWKGYKIVLTNQSTKLSGTSKITVSYGSHETRSGMAANGGDLILSKIKVQPI